MDARDTEVPTEAAVSWAQALAWRLERQLLEPVGSDAVEPAGSDAVEPDAVEPESAAGVIRRLGAVLSMDESLAELAVRVRRRTSRPGELAGALAAGSVVQAFAFRGAVHYV
ncbi:MAG: hypothetical protein ACRCZP_08150, partial [Phycicoccus sp.]